MKILATQRELRMPRLAQAGKLGEVRVAEVRTQPLAPRAAENRL